MGLSVIEVVGWYFGAGLVSLALANFGSTLQGKTLPRVEDAIYFAFWPAAWAANLGQRLAVWLLRP